MPDQGLIESSKFHLLCDQVYYHPIVSCVFFFCMSDFSPQGYFLTVCVMVIVSLHTLKGLGHCGFPPMDSRCQVHKYNGQRHLLDFCCLDLCVCEGRWYGVRVTGGICVVLCVRACVCVCVCARARARVRERERERERKAFVGQDRG